MVISLNWGSSIRVKTEYKPLLVSVIANAILAIVKIWVGFTYSSIALVSDGLHTASDIVTSILGIVGVSVSSRPEDENHHYGHSRYEVLIAFVMGELLLFVAYEIGRESLMRVFRNEHVVMRPVVVYVVLISILVKELITRYAMWIGSRLDNQIIIADAHHHRSDVLSSIAVLAGVLLQRMGFYYGDALAGLVVAFFILRVSVDILWNNLKYLTGSAPSSSFLKELEKRILSVSGVKGVHGLKAHYVGKELHVEVHVEVSENSLEKAHDISHEVKEILESVPAVGRAFIHIEPVKKDDEDLN